jgi:hypothetical protein
MNANKYNLFNNNELVYLYLDNVKILKIKEIHIRLIN